MADPRVRVPDPTREDRVPLNTRVRPFLKRAVVSYAERYQVTVQQAVADLIGLGLLHAGWPWPVTEQTEETTQTGEGVEPLTGQVVPEDRSC
jgi:hypothetical protein